MSLPFAWHTLRTRLPDAWEITTYEKDPVRGRLEFSTLDGPMASLAWAPAKRKHPRGIWERTETSPERLTAVSARSASCRTWTWTFLPPARAGADQILADCIDLPDGIQEYTLHGIHARVPESFAISGISVYPGNILLSFEDDQRRRIVFRRWGLPDQLLRGVAPETFFKKLLETERFRIEDAREKHFRGHPAVRVLFSAAGLTPWARLRLQRAQGRGWIWRDNQANRLLTFEQLGPKNIDLPDPADCFGQ
ncbi:MAG: hypothetical protein JJU05_18205 [Verrucomicrobia bacterium]|nr:hypothetical protein [Verrucomicrobiota bacterium]MCH8528552.1 hypothetical protein [Kiritimatiellia bacterium]